MTETKVWPEIEALYRSDFARFVRVARALTGDRDSALEAVQEGFGDALRNASQWQGRGSWVNAARLGRSSH
jgi:DNA-directed RNA polymerase specialized sigma24 family protein